MPAKRVKEFLDHHGIKYTTTVHSMAYTAQEIAALAHVPGREMAKSVIVRVDGKLVMAVLPAAYHVDLERLREVIGAHVLSLATEAEFKNLFPECEPGAMPPFGNLYGLEVYVDPTLAADEKIVFNSGSHIELMRMNYRDFERLVKPKVVAFRD